MMDAGGMAVGGLATLILWIGCWFVGALAQHIAEEFRILCGRVDIRRDRAGAEAADDHAADSDALCPVHGRTVAPETIGVASGNARGFTNGGRV